MKVQLGGASNVADLEQFVKLAGQRKTLRASTSRGKESTSVSEQVHESEVVSVSELRRLPFGWGLLLNRNGRPILMEMTRWWDRKDGKEIKAAAGRYSKALLDELESKDAGSSEPTAADRADSPVVDKLENTTQPAPTPEEPKPATAQTGDEEKATQPTEVQEPTSTPEPESKPEPGPESKAESTSAPDPAIVVR